jgi:hypothetical protein
MAVRLTSLYVYVYRNKTRGTAWGATNMRTLSKLSGIPYNRLRYWFNSQNKDEVEYDKFSITRLQTDLIYNKTSKINFSTHRLLK